MLLLHLIIVFGTLIMGSRTNPNTWIVDRKVDDVPWLSGKSRTKILQPRTMNANVCQTKDCRLTGQKLFWNINKSVDPCDDFYEYACGGWRTDNPIPPTESSWNQFRIIEKMNNERIREILEAPEVDSDILPVKAAKKLYQSCMNIDQIEKTGIKPLEIILEKMGGWPMIMKESEWNRNEISWQQIQENYSRLNGQATLYSFTVSSNYTNAEEYEFILDQPNFILPQTILLEPERYRKLRMVYAESMKAVALAFAESSYRYVSLNQINKDVDNIINFEIELAKITSPKVANRDLQDVTIDTIQIWYSIYLSANSKKNIDWLKTIQNLFDEVNIQVKNTDVIVLLDPGYISKLARVLEKTSERTIVNYLHWRFVNSMLPFTNEKMRNFAIAVKKELRWQTCISQNQLRHAVSYQFVQKYFPKGSKKIVMEMVRDIVNEVDNQISSSDRMDDETKSAAKEKLKIMMEFIGFPDWYKNVSAILHYYKGLTVGPSYFDNVLNYQKFALRKTLKNLREPVDKNEWTVAPIAVKAYYDNTVNSLTLPAGILELPFFSSSRPIVINYGAIGFMIAHEISRSFRAFGNKFKMNECFVDQFNNYELRELENLDDAFFKYGMQTVNDNIADTAALEAAYEAYQSKLADEELTEDMLPGLEDFSSKQIFFLSFAKSMCESVRPEYLLYAINPIRHSTGRLRVIGTISNSQGFSDAFQCPKGSLMNPENKCNFWK